MRPAAKRGELEKPAGRSRKRDTDVDHFDVRSAQERIT
jgi:hypothetical protein